MIEFRVSPHFVLGMPAVCEVWSDGKFVASVYGTHNGKTGSAILRVISKHAISAERSDAHPVAEVRVTITPREP